MNDEKMRLRAELRFVVEYDVDPKNYYTSDLKEMAQIDYDNWIDEPHMLMASFEPEEGKLELSVEPA